MNKEKRGCGFIPSTIWQTLERPAANYTKPQAI